MGGVVAHEFEDDIAHPVEGLAPGAPAGLEGSCASVFEPGAVQCGSGAVHVGAHGDEVIEPDDAVQVRRRGRQGWFGLRTIVEGQAIDCVVDAIDLCAENAATRPGLIKIADGLQRHLSGGQTVRAVCALPALTGQ